MKLNPSFKKEGLGFDVELLLLRLIRKSGSVRGVLYVEIEFSLESPVSSQHHIKVKINAKLEHR